MTKYNKARLGYAAGCLLTSVGTWLEFGLGYGLIVAGASATASFLILADVDETKEVRQ